jgi:hypothetical protein
MLIACDPLVTATHYADAVRSVFADVTLNMDSFVWHQSNASNAGGQRFTHATLFILIVYVGGRQRAAQWNNQIFAAASQARHNVLDLPEVPANAKFRASGSASDPMLNSMEKPVGLYWYFLAHLMTPNINVLSVCSGSGSMAIAAAIFGANSESIDIDPDMVNGSYQRLLMVMGGDAKKRHDLIAPAVNRVRALRLHKSFVAAEKHMDQELLSSVSRRHLGKSISEGKAPLCGVEACNKPIEDSKNAVMCIIPECEKWVHMGCKTYTFEGTLCCSQACLQKLTAAFDIGVALPQEGSAESASSSASASSQ